MAFIDLETACDRVLPEVISGEEGGASGVYSSYQGYV